jgi:hypothetical protein
MEEVIRLFRPSLLNYRYLDQFLEDRNLTDYKIGRAHFEPVYFEMEESLFGTIFCFIKARMNLELI